MIYTYIFSDIWYELHIEVEKLCPQQQTEPVERTDFDLVYMRNHGRTIPNLKKILLDENYDPLHRHSIQAHPSVPWVYMRNTSL